ncbi:MAG: PAS domain S-box protein, partial [Crenarchaeota archaeon]|nr:PAS domain S-box protein [Thermoproteota archaeon]
SVKSAYGFSPQEMVGKNAFDMTHPDDVKNIVKPNLAILKKTGQTPLVEFRFKTKDGSYLWIESNAKAFIDKKGETKLLSVSRTVEKRKKAEKQLQIFANLFDLISDIILVNDLERNVVYFNESAYKKMGYTKKEMSKMNLNVLEAPENLPILNKRTKQLLKKGAIFFETTYLSKDKKRIPVEVNSKLINLDGKTLLLNIVRDTSDRKKVQEQLTEVNEKLRVIGKLTRHDVRNKLSVININTYLLKKKLVDNLDVKKYLDGIDSAVSTSGRLLDFSKLYEEIGAGAKINIDVKRFFDEAVTLTPTLGKIKIINQTSGLKVFADSLLRQIFYNLIDNSLKHGKKITKIKIYYKKFENHIELYYEDNGVGVPTQDKDKLFIEGFSTSGGTGLGLPIIKKILQVYKWTIQEIGTPGKGIKFVIKIPKNIK